MDKKWTMMSPLSILIQLHDYIVKRVDWPIYGCAKNIR